MTWLQILQLATTLMAQALEAFDQGAKKEHAATVVLSAPEQETVQKLAPGRFAQPLGEQP